MSHVFSQLHEQQISTNINAAQEGKKPVDAICLPKQEKYKLSRNFIIVICQYVMFAKNLTDHLREKEAWRPTHF